MSQFVFITGINGFAGSHLAEYVIEEGLTVAGLVRPAGGTKNLKQIKSKLDLYRGDLLQKGRLAEIITDVQPDLVFHLAAFSNIRTSHTESELVYKTNVLGQLNLLESLRGLNEVPRILVVGSCTEYGQKEGRDKLTEEENFAPQSPYAVTKVTQDLMGYQYYRGQDLPVIRVRPFNQTGPRRPAEYVFSSFARQLAEIEAGRREPVLRTGNLDVVRDYTDVRDAVRAYYLLLREGKEGEVYNLCRGRGFKLSRQLEHLLSLCEKDVEVKRDSARFRENDLEYLVGDNSRLCSVTGWQPQIEMEQTLADLLNFWRHNLPESE